MTFFGITFLRPAYFLLVLILPLVLILRKTRFFSAPSIPLTLSDWKGQAFSFKSPFFRILLRLSKIFLIFSFFFLICALADPISSQQEKSYFDRENEILFVLDTSPSMASIDMSFLSGSTSRFEAAKRTVSTLVSKSDGFSFALVCVASEAALVVPPTKDKEHFLSRLSSVRLGELGDGSALGTGLSCAVYHLAFSRAKSKAIVLLTDGENNAGKINPITAAKLSKEKEISLYVLGLGTNGTVPIEYEEPETGIVKKRYYESAFNPEPLRKIAREGGGPYFEIDSLASLSTSLSRVFEKESKDARFSVKTVLHARYAFFLFASLLCFALSIFVRRVLFFSVA